MCHRFTIIATAFHVIRHYKRLVICLEIFGRYFGNMLKICGILVQHELKIKFLDELGSPEKDLEITKSVVPRAGSCPTSQSSPPAQPVHQCD